MVTVIIAVPFATAVTLPLRSTIAIFVSLEVHVTFLLPAFSGLMVAVSCVVPLFLVMVSLCLSSVTPVTFTESLSVSGFAGTSL